MGITSKNAPATTPSPATSTTSLMEKGSRNGGPGTAEAPSLMTVTGKRILSLILCLVAMLYGFAVAIGGQYATSIVVDVPGVTMESLETTALIAISASVLGSLGTGFAWNLVNRLLLLQAAACASAVAFFVTPYLSQMYLVMGTNAVFGLTAGIVEVTCNAWLLEMWQEHAPPTIFFLYLMTRIGILFATLVPSTAGSHLGWDARQMAQLAFKAAAAAMFMAGILLTIVCSGRSRQRSLPVPGASRTLSSPKSKSLSDTTAVKKFISADGSFEVRAETDPLWHKILLIGLVGAAMAVTTAFGSAMTIVPSLASSMTWSEFGNLVTVHQVASCGSLLLFALLSTRVRVHHCVSACTLLMASGILLIALSQASSIVSHKLLWSGLLVNGIGYAVIVPGLFSYLERKVNVTGPVAGVLVAVNSVAAVAAPALLLFLSNVQKPIVCQNAAFLLLCVLLVAVFVVGRRFK